MNGNMIGRVIRKAPRRRVKSGAARLGQKA
jgi:hypothetical protein